MTTAVEKQLRATLSQMEDCFENGDTRGYWKRHFEFHETFINASGNDVLIEILVNLRLRAHRYRFSHDYYRDHFASNLKVHRAICDLLTDPAADRNGLRELVRHHIEDSSRIFIANIGRASADERLQA